MTHGKISTSLGEAYATGTRECGGLAVTWNLRDTGIVEPGELESWDCQALLRTGSAPTTPTHRSARWPSVEIPSLRLQLNGQIRLEKLQGQAAFPSWKGLTPTRRAFDVYRP
jgi:hypothetical protein